MSSKRLIASCAVMAMIVAAGGWYAVGAFPLRQAVAHVSQDSGSNAVAGGQAQPARPTPENPVPRRLNYVAPVYPPEAAAQQLSGAVVVEATLAADGSIAEARLVGLSIRSGASPGLQLAFTKVTERDVEQFLGKASAGLNPDSALTTAAVKALIQSARDAILAWRYEPPYQAPLVFTVTVNFSPDGKVVGGKMAHAGMPPPPPPPPTGTPGGTTVSHMAPPPPPPPPPPFDGPALRVGGRVRTPTKVQDVKPVYPPLAAEARVQGVVIVEIRIDEEGNVSDARILRSIPLLDAAALEAVQQWKFTPTQMNGKPVPVIMTATVNFTLK